MFTLYPTPKFSRALRKSVKRQPKLEAEVQAVLAKLAQNPRDPSLKSHKVLDDEGREAISSRVTGDLRVTWRYIEEGIELTNFGGHSGGGKVYRT